MPTNLSFSGINVAVYKKIDFNIVTNEYIKQSIMVCNYNINQGIINSTIYKDSLEILDIIKTLRPEFLV